MNREEGSYQLSHAYDCFLSTVPRTVSVIRQRRLRWFGREHISDGFQQDSTTSDGLDPSALQKKERTSKSVMDFNSEKRSGFVGSDMGRSSGSNEGSLGMETTARCALYSTRNTIRYEFNVDSKAEYSALSTTRSQKNKLKQTTPVPL